MENKLICCTPKSLHPSVQIAAATRAIEVNPVNANLGLALTLPPMHLALLTGRLWPSTGVRLTVSFLDNPEAALRSRILLHMNAWNKTANIEFTETAKDGQVRIARTVGEGYWSYIGTDILHVPLTEQTMNLEAFTMQTPDSEFHRVVRHETGHTLAAEHEHLRREFVKLIDRTKAIKYFMRTQGWTRADVLSQVLTPLEDKQLTATPMADQQSIMCYQIPGAITRSGKPIIGGLDIDDQDYALMGRIYPKTVST